MGEWDNEPETEMAETRKLSPNVRSTRSSRVYNIDNGTKSQGTQYHFPSPDEADEDEVKSESDLEPSTPKLATQNDHDISDDCSHIETSNPTPPDPISTIRSRLQLAMFKVRTNQSRRPFHLMSTVPPSPESDQPSETPENYRELMRQRMWLGYLPEVISGRAESPELGVEGSGLLSPPRSPEVLNTREGVEREGGVDVERWAVVEIQDTEVGKDREEGGGMGVEVEIETVVNAGELVTGVSKEVTEGEHDTKVFPSPLHEISIPNQKPRDTIPQKLSQSTARSHPGEAEKPVHPGSVDGFMQANEAQMGGILPATESENCVGENGGQGVYNLDGAEGFDVHQPVTRDVDSKVDMSVAIARYSGSIAEEFSLRGPVHPGNATAATTPTASTQPSTNKDELRALEKESVSGVPELKNGGVPHLEEGEAVGQGVDNGYTEADAEMVQVEEENGTQGMGDEIPHGPISEGDGNTADDCIKFPRTSAAAGPGFGQVDDGYTGADVGAVGIVQQENAVTHAPLLEGDPVGSEIGNVQRLENPVQGLEAGGGIYPHDLGFIHSGIIPDGAENVLGAAEKGEGGELGGNVGDAVWGQGNTESTAAEEAAGPLSKAVVVTEILKVSEVPDGQGMSNIAPWCKIC